MTMRTTLFAFFVASTSVARAQQVVPVAEEPMHHLMLQAERFQVLDPLLLPGDTTLFHLHDAPIHYVMISPSPANAQVLGEPWPDSGLDEQLVRDVGEGWWTLDYAEHPVVHRVTNIGERPFELIAVTNLGHGRLSDDPTGPGAPVPLPGTIEDESRWFRRSRLHLMPDTPVVVPSRSDPVVAVQVSDGGMAVSSSGAERTLSGSTAALGEWTVLESDVRYVLRSSSPGGVVVVLVQVVGSGAPR